METFYEWEWLATIHYLVVITVLIKILKTPRRCPAVYFKAGYFYLGLDILPYHSSNWPQINTLSHYRMHQESQILQTYMLTHIQLPKHIILRPEPPVQVIISLLLFSFMSVSSLTTEWVMEIIWCKWIWTQKFKFSTQNKDKWIDRILLQTHFWW